MLSLIDDRTTRVSNDKASAISSLTHRSSAREKVLEYRFLADLTAELMCRGIDFDVLRSDVDAWGADLVVWARGVFRHIQLKAMIEGGKRSHVTINTRLAASPSGCVIWMTYDPRTFRIGNFLWFGGAPGEPLPSLGNTVARHTRGNSSGEKRERPDHRVVKRSSFIELTSIAQLADLLFGGSPERQLMAHLATRPTSPDSRLEQVRKGEFGNIPEDIDWDNAHHLAHLIDGHELIRSLGLGDAATLEEQQRSQAERTGRWEGNAAELWIALFLQYRRWRMSEPHHPSVEQRQLLDELCRSLRTTLMGI